MLEELIALFAFASPALLRLIDQGYIAAYRGLLEGAPGLFVAARVVLAAAVLLPPTLLMGGTVHLQQGFDPARRRGRPPHRALSTPSTPSAAPPAWRSRGS